MRNKMKNSSFLLVLFLLIVSSCTEKSPNSDNNQKDSLCTFKDEIGKSNFDNIEDELGELAIFPGRKGLNK